MRRPFLAAALLLTLAGAARADGFIVIERPPEPLRRLPATQAHFPLAVQEHKVEVTIDGQVATTSVDQTFRNPLDARLEGTYIFPLPEDAAVTQFSLWIDGQEMQGEVLDRQKALEIYEGIVRSMQDPALLEYAGRGVFKVRIFPIEPRSTRRVRLTYRQVLTADAGRCRYVYPLNTEKFSSAPLERASVLVTLDAGQPLKGVYSPWHEVDVRRDGETKARISWEASQVRPDRDFVVDYDLAPGEVGLSLRTHALPGEDGSFLLLVAPQVTRGQRVAKDVVFVFDTSGSMAADGKMEQARKALAYCISRLDPQDRFAVVDYATDARAYKDALVAATPEERAAADAYVARLVARGGTAIDEALRRAFLFRSGRSPRIQPGRSTPVATSDAASGRPFVVVFMTDGQPTIGETDPERILANLGQMADAESRVFVWGVGHDVNTHLLDRIARDHRGERNYVLPAEDIEVAMSSFYDKISEPVLTDLELSFSGVATHDVYPRRLPDLFHGGQITVAGRFRGEGHGAVRLRGKVNGQEREFVWEGPFRRAPEADYVPLLWARRKIGFLLDQMRLNGETQELRDEVIALARRYGLPTPYTSYLVVEEGATSRGPGGGRPGQPAPVPATPAEDAAREAFDHLRREARAGGASAPSAPPSAEPASGEGAVRSSRDLARMQQGEKAEADEAETGVSGDVVDQVIRTVEGKTFYRTGEGWIDSTVGARSEAWKQVAYLSDAYFQLLRQRPELGAYLSLGKVLFRVGDEVFEIK